MPRELFQIRFWKIELVKLLEIKKYNGYHRAWASMIYKFFDKKRGSRMSVNEQLAEELHKQVIKKFKRKKCMQD